MSNFQCPHCGMTNIDCGRDGYKTPKEIELQAENEELKKQVKLKNQFRDYAHKYKNALDEIEEILRKQNVPIENIMSANELTTNIIYEQNNKLIKILNIIKQAKYVNITNEICEKCETKYMLQKISECEVD